MREKRTKKKRKQNFSLLGQMGKRQRGQGGVIYRRGTLEGVWGVKLPPPNSRGFTRRDVVTSKKSNRPPQRKGRFETIGGWHGIRGSERNHSTRGPKEGGSCRGKKGVSLSRFFAV